MTASPDESHAPTSACQLNQMSSESPPGMPVASTAALMSGVSWATESRHVAMPADQSSAVTIGCLASHHSHRCVGGAASPGNDTGVGGNSDPLPITVTQPATMRFCDTAAKSTVVSVNPVKPHDQRIRSRVLPLGTWACSSHPWLTAVPVTARLTHVVVILGAGRRHGVHEVEGSRRRSDQTRKVRLRRAVFSGGPPPQWPPDIARDFSMPIASDRASLLGRRFEGGRISLAGRYAVRSRCALVTRIG
jgi:hypothetical protein